MQFIALGVQIAVLIVGGTLGGIGMGYLADKYLGIYPWGVIAGIIIGVFVGGVGVYQVVKSNESK